MIDEIDYYESIPEPVAVDWRGRELTVGTRLMYGCWGDAEIVQARLKRGPIGPESYAATVKWLEWEIDTLYMGIQFDTGETETLHSHYTRAHGDPAMEFGDIDKVGP